MDTRIHDRKELIEARDNAHNTQYREHYDKLLNSVRNESEEINKLRENLIKAVRGGDNRSLNYYQEEIQKHG